MTPATPAVSGLCASALRVALAYIVLVPLSLLMAAAPRAKYYDIPAGTADRSLKQFSEQAGLEVIFSTQIARAVKTNPVKGEMMARQALDAMLADTGLMIIQDQKTGAFTVSRNDLNGHAASPPAGANERDAQKKK